MLMLISPAKSLDFESPTPKGPWTEPEFLQQAQELVGILKKKTPAELASLMGLSDGLAQLNAARYGQWRLPLDEERARPALWAFTGDVYKGIDVRSLPQSVIPYLGEHLRILSGLYGLLRPTDLMLPYRLEMGTKLVNDRGSNLYAFWRNVLTERLAELLSRQGASSLVNLASNEYSKAVQLTSLPVRVVTPVFQDWKNGEYKMISFFAKKARGLMVRFAALEGITEVEDLKSFDLEGYAFAADASTAERWVFRRRQA